MKNLKTISVLSVLMLSLLIGVNNSSAATLATTLKGKILLQVEQNGEAWYVNPVNELRYYLGRPNDAFNVMRELGLGISNKDFDSFNGYAPSRLSGRILLKVADSGKAYYVNTNDLKMYYLGRPADAFNVMRELGLGITDKNLGLISVANNKYTNQQYGFEFQYPANFKISTFKPGDINKIFGLKISDPGDSLILVSNTKDGNKTLQDEKNLLVESYGTDRETKLEIKDFFIGGSPAFSASFYSVTVSDTGGGKHLTPNFIIETYKNNYFYVLETASITSTMFSTFKFTSSINGLFESAVNKSDFSTASKYFADNVYVVIEGSSCCGEVTTGRAKQELERINGLIFTFNPNDAVVKEYLAYIASQYPNRRLIKNSPTLYFDEYTIGVESDVSQNNKASIGYKVSNDKITDLFINVGRDR